MENNNMFDDFISDIMPSKISNDIGSGLESEYFDDSMPLIESKNRFRINNNEIQFRGIEINSQEGTNLFNKILNLSEVKSIINGLGKKDKLGVTFYIKSEE